MFNTAELLEKIRPLATNAEIARILKVAPPRISEMFRGDRKVQLDEAWRLVQHFGLDREPANPVTTPIAKLMVLHVARGVGVYSADDHQVEELAKDLAAFATCALDPQWRGQMESLAQILQGIEARREAGQDTG